jgi:type I restriction enzyme, R subunit
MTLGSEYEHVEKPLIAQLTGMGWTHLEGGPPSSVKPTDPAASGRSAFSEVFLTGRLRSQLYTLNRDKNGKPWLDGPRLDQAVSALIRIAGTSLLEANQLATDLLLNGLTVDGLPDWDGGRDQRVQYIDWEQPLRNDFTVISQFRVDIPGSQGRRCITPDEVLFVNGIPMALIECKKPGERLAEAVRQHHRYADRRGAAPPEGNPRLFHTMQLLIATSGDRAMLGSITSEPEHYTPWRDPYPLSSEEFAHRLGKPTSAVSQQDILVGVVLDPVRLLDIIHNYVTFMSTDEGKAVKAVPRYQQYRAVSRAVDRLLNGKTRREDADGKDRRGGVVWHTQGSGKSLTMSFLVRTLRTVPGLGKTKVVVVTDRRQLQGQLSKTLALSAETVTVAKTMAKARQLLAQHGPGIVFVMIQKQQDEHEPGKAGRSDDEIIEAAGALPTALNTDESIVVLIDEAHRSHASMLHKNLMEALPNCARIGFTGTPIIMGGKKKTEDIFGGYIDMYKLADAERDGAVVPILYAGRTVEGAVRNGRDLDEVFEDMLADHTPAEMQLIKRRYATKGDVLDAEELIRAKAKNMLRHYVETVLPNGFKAQLAAHSREATLRYRKALLAARDELVSRIEALSEVTRNADPATIGNRQTAYLVRAARYLDLLKAIDFVPVISIGTTNDEQKFEPWTDPGHQDTVIRTFTSPFPSTSELAAGARPPAFLLVKSMLLTGFDAPVEQVLYLDRSMQGAELLQAIARVNRPATGKQCGYVIDYAGVTRHLTKALAAYSAEDIASALSSLREQANNLRPQLDRLSLLFKRNGVIPGTSETAMENCVQLLADGQLRDEFETELKLFLATLEIVLPEPVAGPFLDAARLYAEIARRTRQRYRLDGDFDSSLYGAKVRELIDQHMIALGVGVVLPPASLTDPGYQAKVAGLSARAKASEMEHAIRHHLRLHHDEHPVHYRRLSEDLERILAEHAGNWEQLAFSLAALLEEIATDDPERMHGISHGLNQVESALYGVLAEETSTDGVMAPNQGQHLAGFARRLHTLATAQTTRRDFWRHTVDQYGFISELTTALVLAGICDQAVAPALADKLFEVIRANRHRITPAE